MFQIHLKKFFVTRKVKNTIPWTYLIIGCNGEKLVGTFYEKELQKAYQKEFKVAKAIKRRDDKLYVKLKGYSSSLNSWIGKKDII